MQQTSPPTCNQERLWLLDRLEPGSSVHNLPCAVRFGGAVEVPELERCLGEIVRRHPSLRTTFVVHNGRPQPRIAPPATLRLPVVDLSALAETDRETAAADLIARETSTPFDLDRGPLHRARLLRLAPTRHLLLQCLHRIIADEWSLGVLCRELATALDPSSGRCDQALDGTGSGRQPRPALSAAERERRLACWRRQLADLPRWRLPTDRPRRRGARRTSTLTRELGPDLAAALARLSDETGEFPATIVLTALLILLGRTTGQDDVVAGVPISNRTGSETAGRIGPLADVLVVRADLSPRADGRDPSFRDLLHQVGESVRAAAAHYLPFALLVAELQPEPDLERHPLFEVFCRHAGDPELPSPALARPGLRMERIPVGTSESPFDLALGTTPTTSGVGCELVFNRHLFDRVRMDRLLHSGERLLAAIVARPDAPHTHLPLLSPGERHQILVEWSGRPADGSAGGSIDDPFIAQAARRPEAVALVFADRHLTYRELSRRALGLGHLLRRHGVGAEDRVAFCFERSPAMLVALLGVLRAGGAWLALDPQHPPSRLRLLLADAGVRLLVTTAALAGRFAGWRGLRLLLDRDGHLPAAPPAAEAAIPAPPLGCRRLAYVTYTSGSTGTPRGVLVAHRGAAAYLDFLARSFGLGPDDVTLQIAPVSFDMSLRDLVGPLAAGGRVVVVDPVTARDPAALLATSLERGVTCWLGVVPAFFRHLVAAAGAAGSTLQHALRLIVIGGEGLPLATCRQAQAVLGGRVRLVNQYGTTESYGTVCCELPAQPVPVPSATDQELAPIGRPGPQASVFLLDRSLRPVGIGTPGELHVGGLTLARSYLNLPALTAEKLIPHPWTSEPGARLHRTGDEARFRPDGGLELLGRRDRQLQLRGQRIEPGEIEAVLRTHPAVGEAVVVARRMPGEPEDDRRLVAFIASPQGPPDPAGEGSDLRRFLSQHLPAHLVPAHFVRLDKLPLTARGKIDRRRLPQVELRGPDPLAAAARSPIEEILADLWTAVLGTRSIGIHDNFFALGGHSLLATQVLSRMRQTLSVELPLRRFFEGPTVARLAAEVEDALRRPTGLAAPPLVPLPRPARIPLSFAQRRLWFLEQMVPGDPAYHLAAAWRLRGRLAVAALERSLAAIVGRHEILRTTFASVDGRPHQVPAPPAAVSLPVVDLRPLTARPPAAGSRGPSAELRRLLRWAATAPFDLARGPLLRGLLLRPEAGEHVLVLTLHHVVSDGWSQGVLHRELTALYEAFAAGRPAPLPELPLQYADFSLWQRGWLRGRTLNAELAHWRRRLRDLPRLELPVDRPRRARAATAGARGAVCALPLSGDLTAALERLSLAAGASLFMTFLASFMVLLARTTGRRDVVVGTPIANRNRAEIENLIGFFVNNLVLRGDLSPGPADRDVDFLSLLKRVRETALDAYAHQDLPFEVLVEELAPERDASRHPLFQVTLAVHNAPRPELRLAGLELSPMELETRTVRFDVELHFRPSAPGLDGQVIYRTDLFDATTMVRLAGHFANLLAAVAANPNRPVAELPLLTRAQGHQALVEWNDTGTRWPQAGTLDELFAAQALRTPDAVALVGERARMSFRELDERSHRLARRLRRLGVGPEVRVGVCMERSPELVVAFLAILKAGGAYVPVDPDHPDERRRFMLEDCQARVVLSGKSLPEPPSFPLKEQRFRSPEHSAYVLYTSGSTGRPKGVVISHRALVNHMLWMQRRWPLDAADAVMQKTPLSFDASVWELWAPLLEGARLVLARPGGHREPAWLVRTLRRQRVSVLQVVPTLLELLLAEEEFARCRDLRRVFCGGEPLTAALHRRFLAAGPGAELINLYGPTEATIDATWATAGPVPEGRPEVPIGRPVANLRAHLLDDHLRPVPVGATGELHLAGAGLARGYLARPRRTAERFVPSPFHHQPGDRLYRTGDLARQRPDGRIEFVARRDHQVKLRGFRLELGEIESVLREHPAVADAVVTVRDEEPRLVAWVTAEADPGEPWQRDHVAAWRTLYDELYGRPSGDQAGDFNTVGWVSSYTGQPIPEPEMRDWLERTVARIRSLAPQRVLEIGCGTGLVLWRIAPRCRRYLATDFSPPVLAGLAAQLAERDLVQVELRCRTADDFAGLRAGEFDTVILNSVVQYFPSSDYLLAVLAGAVEVTAPGGAIFLGDVRSLPLLPAFCASVELDRADPSLPVAHLRERIRSRREGEKELVIDPAFFAALPPRLSRIARVRIQPRSGPFRNELTRFRYDVVLHLDDAGPSPETVRLDWEADRLTVETLRRILAERRPPALVVGGIPDRRLAGELDLLGVLAAAEAGVTAGQLRERLRSLPPRGVEPDAVLALGRDLSYRGELSWTAGGADGRFAVLFRRRGEQGQAMPEEETLPLPPPGWTNRPLRRRLVRELVPDLRRHLAARLPDPMVPAAFVVVESLPLTPSGKVDRGALVRRPLPDAGGQGETDELAAPRTVTEQTLARIWSELLGRRPIGIDENFFALGGHSLLATQVVARVRRTLGVELPVRSLFEDPTVRELAARVAAARYESWQGPMRGPMGGVTEGRRALPSPPAGLPLSFAQERLWFLQQLMPASPVFNVAAAFQFSGRLDAAALDRALSEIVRRHEILRTSFPLADEPRQRIAPASGRTLAVVDLRALAQGEEEARRLVDREAARPFDLTRGPPWRPFLLRTGPRRHVLVLLLHHILIDGWSQEIFYRELETLYDAFAAGAGSPLADLPLQYADFAVWQREWLRGGVLAEQLAWWKEELAGLATLPLATDRPRPAVRSGRGTVRRFGLSPELTAALRRLSRERNGSLFMTLLAAFMTLLYRYGGQPDVALGSPVANRQWAEIEGLIGFFVNTVVLRGDLRGDPSFRALLRRVRETALGACAHQDAPFEKVVAALEPRRDPGSTPLFQVMFAFQNTLEQAWVPALSGLSVSRLEIAEASVQFDLALTMWEKGDRLEGALELATDLLDLTTGLRFLAHLEALLRAVAAAPGTSLLALPLLAAAESQQILREWNDTAARGFSQRSVSELFAEQAAKRPDAVALVGAGGELTYGRLAGRAHGLAHHLRRLGVGPETVVAVVMERSPEMLVAVLGILRAGAAYLPLEAADPPDRLAFMVADSSAAVLVTRKRWREKLRIPAMESVPVVFTDAADDFGDPGPRGGGRGEESAENLAYVIYTSGSTGRPRGVLVRHRSLAGHTVAAGRDYGLGPADRVLQFASLSFDASAEEIFPALTRGATLVLRTDAMLHSVPEFLRAVRQQRITVLNLPTAFWHELCAALPAAGAQLPETVRLVIIGGEKAATDHLAAWRRQVDSRVRLVNTYGPTEATIVASRRPAPATGRQIGRPLANVRIHVLDRRLRPVPPGAPGILYLAGLGLARGYLNRPRRTAASFVPNPFASRRGSRLYNSGDLARYRPDGTLEFLGRIDYQVKIRGHRIETGEIEALLRRHPRVREAVVVAHNDQPGGRLVAYVTGPDGPPSVAALRRFLEQKLPAVMVPAAFIFQETLPRTPGGKVDRQALPPPDGSRPELASTYAAPANEWEETVAASWQEALAVDRVGVDDNFFDLGGHSLLLVRVRSRLEARLGRRLPMVDLFRYPTIRSLAQHLGEADRGAQPTQPPGAATTRLARRPAVRRHRRIRADHRAP